MSEKTSEKTISQSPAKSKGSRFLVSSILTVLVLSGLGYAAYQFYYLPDRVANEVNQNIIILNDNNKATKQKYEAVLSILNDDKTTINDKSARLKESDAGLKAVVAETQAKQTEVKDGFNDDTKKIAESVRGTLRESDSRNFTTRFSKRNHMYR